MIRSFSLRDLPLVRRLSNRRVCLDAESALTGSSSPLKGALLNIISSSQAPTFVWRAEEGDASGFAQVEITNDLNARLSCLAIDVPPSVNGNANELYEDGWLSLLDDVVAALGQRGIHSVVAEVDESGLELAILRKAGFAIYTRQDIWRLHEWTTNEARAHLCPYGPGDEWDVEWLYANTVPPLIQLVEPSPPQHGDLWVLREDGELTAFVNVAEGVGAVWQQIFIHPSAYAQAQEIVDAAVEAAHDGNEKVIYCCVRRYQSWLKGALEKSGFELCHSQAVMVKHISAPVTKKAGALDRLLSAQGVRPTTLLQRYDSQEPAGNSPKSDKWILG